MTNTALFKSLIDRYNKVAYTHQYIWGFSFKGNIYMAITDASYMSIICKLDKASRGAGYALRFCPNNQQKMALMTKSQLICSEKYFNDMVSVSKYNKGEIFEKMSLSISGRFGKKIIFHSLRMEISRSMVSHIRLNFRKPLSVMKKVSLTLKDRLAIHRANLTEL